MSCIKKYYKNSSYQELARNYIETNRVVGLSLIEINGDQTEVFSFGHANLEKSSPVTNLHQFEIGSLAKIFTSILVADLILKKKLSLSTSLGEILSNNFSELIRKITIKDLLTHTSGLPRIPSNLKVKDYLNPYVEYSEKQLVQELESIKKIQANQYLYSNLGFAVIGFLVSKVTDLNFKVLMQALLKKLNMPNTFYFEEVLGQNVCVGYDEKFKTVKHWNMGVFNSAGGLFTNSKDMETFLKFILANDDRNELNAALKMTYDCFYEAKDFNVGLGWHLVKDNNQTLMLDGATYGSYSKIRVNLKTKKAFVYLSNTNFDPEELELIF